MFRKIVLFSILITSSCAAGSSQLPFDDLDLCSISYNKKMKFVCSDGSCETKDEKYSYVYDNENSLVGVTYIDSELYLKKIGIKSEKNIDSLYKKVKKIDEFKNISLFGDDEELNNTSYLQLDNFKSCSTTKGFYLFIDNDKYNNIQITASTVPYF